MIPLAEGDFKRKLTEKQMSMVVNVTDGKESEGWGALYPHHLLKRIMESRKRPCDSMVCGMAGEETPGFYPCC